MSDTSIAQTTFYGALRGLCVHGMIFPMDVIKVRQQATGGSIMEVVRHVLQTEGKVGFYKGILHKNTKVIVKQMWCWHFILGGPRYLERYQLEELQKQALTGLAMAKIDAVTSKHLDRGQIVSAFQGENLSIRALFKEGSKGYTTYWSHLSVAWCTSLVALKYFKQREGDQKLSLSQQVKVGVEAGAVVSLATAPFDCANTIKQTRDLRIKQFILENGYRALFRGASIRAVALVIHNIATSIVIEALS